MLIEPNFCPYLLEKSSSNIFTLKFSCSIYFQYGEIDCWQIECPPVTCLNPVTEDGDCCPRCEDDPCAREISINDSSVEISSQPQPCSYSGIMHDSGSSWQDPYDKCTTCDCKVRAI